MIYDINGNALSTVYNKNGASANPVYDVNGNAISTASELTVMTYNYQWCAGLNSLAYQQEIYNRYKPDIIGLQEAGQQSTRAFPAIAQTALSDYPYKYLSEYYNYNGIASKIELEDVTDNSYASQAGSGIYTYQKCYLYVGGKKIAWYNTHLEYDTTQGALNRKYAQMKELFDDVVTEDYVIITGDFNMYGQNLESADYINMGKQFADAGYNMANWTEENFVMTWTDATSATSLSEFKDACDSIITSSNINITSITFDTTKLSYINNVNALDHIPVIARVRIS